MYRRVSNLYPEEPTYAAFWMLEDQREPDPAEPEDHKKEREATIIRLDALRR